MEDEIEFYELNEDAKPYGIKHRSFYFSREVVRFVGNVKYERVYYSMFDQLL